MSYEPAACTYLLPPEHATLLTGTGAGNLAPMATIIEHFGTHLAAVEDCFRTGGGVSYDAFGPQFTDAMDDLRPASTTSGFWADSSPPPRRSSRAWAPGAASPISDAAPDTRST